MCLHIEVQHEIEQAKITSVILKVFNIFMCSCVRAVFLEFLS